MNEIVNRFLLAGDKFMPEMHLKQLGFTYSACGPFTKNKKRIQKLKETGDAGYIYKNELDKACFQQDMAYRSFKDLGRRIASDEAFHIAKNPKHDVYQRGLPSMVCKLFDKNSKGSAADNNENKQNRCPLDLAALQLAKELHEPIIINLKKRTVYSGFKDNIWGADLADMQLISKFNKGFRFLLCVIEIFSKYAWVVPLKDKRGVSMLMLFKKY